MYDDAAAAESEKDRRIQQLERPLGRKALEIELYQLLFAGRGEPQAPKEAAIARLGPPEDELVKLFRRMPKPNKQLLLLMARKLASMEKRT